MILLAGQALGGAVGLVIAAVLALGMNALMKMFSTHPDTEQRIARRRGMADTQNR